MSAATSPAAPRPIRGNIFDFLDSFPVVCEGSPPDEASPPEGLITGSGGVGDMALVIACCCAVAAMAVFAALIEDFLCACAPPITVIPPVVNLYAAPAAAPPVRIPAVTAAAAPIPALTNLPYLAVLEVGSNFARVFFASYALNNPGKNFPSISSSPKP